MALDVEALADRLFPAEHLSAALVGVLVERGDGLLAQLPPAQRAAIAGVVDTVAYRMRLRVATPERLRAVILERRPDLAPVLDTEAGLVWCAGELHELQSLAHRTAV